MNPIATLFPHLSLPPSLPLLCLSLLGAAGRPFPTSRLCPPGALPVGLRGAQRGCWNQPCPTRGNPDFSSQRLLSPAAPRCCPNSPLGPPKLPLPRVGLGAAVARSDTEDGAAGRGVTFNQSGSVPVATSPPPSPQHLQARDPRPVVLV